MSQIIHHLACCFVLLTLVEGNFTNTSLSLSPLSDVKEASPSQTTLDERLDAFTTENHYFGRLTQEMCQLFNLCYIHPNSSSLINASQTSESWEQVAKRDDNFVKTQTSPFSLRSSQADDGHTSDAKNLQQGVFSIPLKLVNSNIGISTQSHTEDQGSSSTSSATTHTQTLPVANEVNLDKITGTQTIQLFTGNTQTSSNTSRPTAFSSGREEPLLHKCQELDTFFLTFKLCENRDSGDPSRSCKGRCGQAQSLDHSFDNCSCDDKCVVYNDCCVDFYVHCNQTFQQSVQLHGQKLFSYRSHRHYSEVAVIISCSNTDVTNSPLTSPTSPMPPSTIPIGTSLPYYGRMADLNKYELVADLSTGLIYDNVDAFYSCIPKSRSNPFLIPLVLPLKGRYIYGQSIEFYVFPFPNFEYSPYILNPFPTMRGTFHDETVDCDSCPVQTVNYFCGAVITNEDVPWLKDHTIFSFQLASDPLHQFGNCSHWPSISGGRHYWMRYTRHVLGVDAYSLETSFSYSWTATRHNLEAQSPDTVGTVTIRRRLHERSLDLEFTGAPWSRMRCAHSYLRLDECQILQCSQGSFWTDTGKCWVPSSVLVSAEVSDSNTAAPRQSRRLFAPFCHCLILFKSIKSLQIYELGRLFLDKEECQIPVAGFYGIDNLVGNKSQQTSGRNGSDTQGKESGFGDMVGNIHKDLVEYLENNRKSANIDNDLNKTVLERALLKGLTESRHYCTEIFSNLKIVFADHVRDFDLHLDFSFSYDDIYTDVSQEKRAPPIHPENYASNRTGHNYQCQMLLQVHLMVIFVVTYCIMF